MPLSEFQAAHSPQPFAPFDLTTADREPLQLQGGFQPQGILPVSSEPQFGLIQVSDNTQAILGIFPQTLLGQPLSTLLSDYEIAALQTHLAGELEQVNPFRILIPGQGTPAALKGAIHRSPCNQLSLEPEPLLVVKKKGNCEGYLARNPRQSIQTSLVGPYRERKHHNQESDTFANRATHDLKQRLRGLRHESFTYLHAPDRYGDGIGAGFPIVKKMIERQGAGSGLSLREESAAPFISHGCVERVDSSPSTVHPCLVCSHPICQS